MKYNRLTKREGSSCVPTQPEILLEPYGIAKSLVELTQEDDANASKVWVIEVLLQQYGEASQKSPDALVLVGMNS